MFLAFSLTSSIRLGMDPPSFPMLLKCWENSLKRTLLLRVAENPFLQYTARVTDKESLAWTDQYETLPIGTGPLHWSIETSSRSVMDTPWSMRLYVSTMLAQYTKLNWNFSADIIITRKRLHHYSSTGLLCIMIAFKCNNKQNPLKKIFIMSTLTVRLIIILFPLYLLFLKSWHI